MKKIDTNFVKCSFCPYSIVKNGKLSCCYDQCILSQEEIFEILRKVKGGEG